MPPTLVLFFCICFVFFLLYVDRKLSSNVSKATWIPAIWIIYASSKTLGDWFGSTGGTLESGSPLDRTFLIVLLSSAIWVLFQRGHNWSSAIKDNPWLFFLITFMLISIFWSVIPNVSFKRWVKELSAIVMGFVISLEKDPRQAILSVIRRTIYILIPFSLVLIKYFPQYGRMYETWSGMQMWIGVTDQKNGLGRLAALASFFIIWDLIKGRNNINNIEYRYQNHVNIFVLGISVWLLKGPAAAFSATSIVMLATGLSCLIALLWLRGHKKNLSVNIIKAGIAFLIIYGIATPLIGKLPVGDISLLLGRESTLTGRSGIWAALVPIALRKPILGHGYGGFWTSANIKSFYFPAHNGYLEVVLVLGFVGLILVSIFLLSLSRKAHRELERDFFWGAFWICWLIMVLLNNISESSLETFSGLHMAIPIWLSVSLRANKNQPVRPTVVHI